MNKQEIILAILVLVFAIVGGIVDTYVSYRYHLYEKPSNKKLKVFKPAKTPSWLINTIPVWWLVIFVMLLPFLMVFVVSGYSLEVVKVYLVFGILASVLWDLAFSFIWSGKWISDSCITWFWVGKFNLGFDKRQVVWWHLTRVVAFLFLLYIFYFR